MIGQHELLESAGFSLVAGCSFRRTGKHKCVVNTFVMTQTFGIGQSECSAINYLVILEIVHD
jgi:hypothetical protein